MNPAPRPGCCARCSAAGTHTPSSPSAEHCTSRDPAPKDGCRAQHPLHHRGVRQLGRPAGASGSSEHRAGHTSWCRTGRAGLGALPAPPDWSWLFYRAPATDGSPTHGTSSPGSLGQERCFRPSCTQGGTSRSAPADPGGTGVLMAWGWRGPDLAASSRCEAPGTAGTELLEPQCCCCPYLSQKEASEGIAASPSPVSTGRWRGTSPRPHPQSPRGWGHYEDGEGRNLPRGHSGSEGAVRAPRRPDPASLLQEQRALLRSLWQPLNYQWDWGGVRAAELPPESHRAGTGTAPLQITEEHRASGCLETCHGGDTGKRTPSCPRLPGWSGGAGGGAASTPAGYGPGRSQRQGRDHHHSTGRL